MSRMTVVLSRQVVVEIKEVMQTVSLTAVLYAYQKIKVLFEKTGL